VTTVSSTTVTQGRAHDLGVPWAGEIAHYLHPPTFTDWFFANVKVLHNSRSSLKNYRHELQLLALALSGHEECAQRLACTAASHFASIPGAGTLSFLLGSQTGGLEKYMLELVDVFRYSIMLGDDCKQYQCTHEHHNINITRGIQPRRKRHLHYLNDIHS